MMQIKMIAKRLLQLGISGESENLNQEGKDIYTKKCIACHGAEGEGNPAIGAPKLNDDIWLYGNSDEVLYQTIAKGRTGIMPAFDERLDDTQIRMLTAWLIR